MLLLNKKWPKGKKNPYLITVLHPSGLCLLRARVSVSIASQTGTTPVDLSWAPNQLNKGKDGGRKDLRSSHETEEEHSGMRYELEIGAGFGTCTIHPNTNGLR